LVDFTESSLETQVRESLGETLGSNASIAALAGQHWEASRVNPVIWVSPPSSDVYSTAQALRPLARYIWALSLERKEKANVLFVALTTGPIKQLVGYEDQVLLTPLSREYTPDLINGILGTSTFEKPLIHRIHSASGGNTHALNSVVASLIKQHLITRRDNLWSFREHQQIQSIRVPALTDPWSSAWQHLDRDERQALVRLELLPTGIALTRAHSILGSGDGTSPVGALVAKGWVRSNTSRVRVSSEGIRSAIRTSAGDSLRKQAALYLLKVDGLLSREERADLALTYQPDPAVLEEGLWASESAVQRGESSRAASLFERCLAIANGTKNVVAACDVSLRLAELLHKSGDDLRALHYLDGQFPWQEHKEAASSTAARDYQLGTIYSSLGRLDEACASFIRAIDLASCIQNPGLLLRSHAGLAEIEWQHRGGEVRSSAIERIRKILVEYKGTVGLESERAALTYGLGAALVRIGELGEATRVLQDSSGWAQD